jgi:hypothetical protein
MFKIRTAKREFRGSCGHQIKPGARFVVEEPRPAFHCADCGRDKVVVTLKQVHAELSPAGKPVAEGAR